MVLKKTRIPNERQAWTPGNLSRLKLMARRGFHAAQIARHLNRTEGAIRQKAFSAGISLDTREAQKRRKAAQSRTGKIARASQKKAA